MTTMRAFTSLALVGSMMAVSPARAQQTDIVAGNGVIHVVDTVLLPPTTSE